MTAPSPISRVERDVDLATRSTYGLRARAGALVTLRSRRDLEDLETQLRSLAPDWRVLGAGSNVILGEGCRNLTLLSLEGDWDSLEVDESGRARLGAGISLPVAARRLSAAGWSGFEWAVGIPGRAGGAAVMNAGGHGADLARVVRRVEVWRDGEVTWWEKESLDLRYRHSSLGENDLVLSVEVQLEPGDPDESAARLRDIVRWRREHQPGGRNAGSVFTNPVGDHAARLLEAAGVKGVRRGGAEVSSKHANFILCDPGTDAREVIDLMVFMRERVLETHGVALTTEHRFLGVEAPW